jgi:hypothetical protein
MIKNDTTSSGSSARGALRRLLLVLAITAGVIIYAYGWQVTDINLEAAREENRQQSVTRALRELLSPNIFAQATETETFETAPRERVSRSRLMGRSSGLCPPVAWGATRFRSKARGLPRIQMSNCTGFRPKGSSGRLGAHSPTTMVRSRQQ